MMQRMSNRDAAERGLFGGTAMDEVKEKRESEPRTSTRGERDKSPSFTCRSGPPEPANQIQRNESVPPPPRHALVFRREDIERAVPLPKSALARPMVPPPVWKNPARVEAGQIWGFYLEGVEHIAPDAVDSVDTELGHARFRGGETAYAPKMLAPISCWRCVGFQVPSGERVMVGEVRAYDYTNWTITGILAGECVAMASWARGCSDGVAHMLNVMTWAQGCPDRVHILDVMNVMTWPLNVEATRRAFADRIDREGVPVLTLRPNGQRTSETRVVGFDPSAPGPDFTGISVWREDPYGQRRIEEVYRQPGAMVARGPSWTGLSAGPHVEAEPPPRDHGSEARGLCLGISWMSGETDQNYAARLDVEEARQVAQKISPLLARPIPFRASIAIPFEAAVFTAPTAQEIRSLADSLYHLEAELSRGMRNERAIDEALAGFCQRTRRTGPGWLRPSLERYVAERERGQR